MVWIQISDHFFIGSCRFQIHDHYLISSLILNKENYDEQ